MPWSCKIGENNRDILAFHIEDHPGVSLAVLSQVADAAAAELKILTPRSTWTVLNEIGPQFEANSGYKLAVVTGIAATLAAPHATVSNSGRRNES